jgi:hypothetical protein
MYALTKIKGVGRRYSNLVCKKADVDLNKRYIHPPTNYSHRTHDNSILMITCSTAPANSPPKNSNAL